MLRTENKGHISVEVEMKRVKVEVTGAHGTVSESRVLIGTTV